MAFTIDLIRPIAIRLPVKSKLIILIILFVIGYILISTETLYSVFGTSYNYNLRTNLSSDFRPAILTRDVNGRLIYFHLPDFSDKQTSQFFKKTVDGAKNCFISGTNLIASNRRCECVDGFFGDDCGVPEVVWKTSSLFSGEAFSQLRLKDRPKRIVLSVIICETRQSEVMIDFLNTSLSSLSDVVDLFIIAEIVVQRKNEEHNDQSSLLLLSENESAANFIYLNSANSNRTQHTNNSNALFSLEEAFKRAPLDKYSEMVIIQSLNVTPSQWSQFHFNDLQTYAFRTIWSTVFRRVTDFRPDDLLIFMSTNTFPLRKVIYFLKFYDGFSEPIKLISSVVDRQNKLLANEVNENYLLNIVLTFEYLNFLCRYDLNQFIKSQCLNNEEAANKFMSTYWPINHWSIGDLDRLSATFTCSNCSIDLSHSKQYSNDLDILD